MACPDSRDTGATLPGMGAQRDDAGTGTDRADRVAITVVHPALDPAVRPAAGWLAETARAVLDLALAPPLRDDRFDGWQPGPDLVAAIAVDGDGPIGLVGGSLDRGRLQLDALVVAHRSEPGRLLDRLLDAVEPAIAASPAHTVELWARPAEPWHELVAEQRGFTELRALHQLRCSLPVDAPSLPTRAFEPGRDEQRLLDVNNRAFSDHPDQGGMTLDDLADAASQPWFDPDGIRLYPDPDAADGRLAGFCWTKIHEPRDEGEPRLGEIYAIGIDPDHHGRGLGAPMTAAGLSWLADRGLTTGMLYVEADNEPALRTYARLGFEQHRTDRAWSRPVGAGPDDDR